MTFQHFSRQGRGDSQELESSHLEKQHVIYNGGGIPIYWYSDKEIPPWGGCPLPSMLSLLTSVTNNKGKAERAFQVVVTPPAWP
jgi:hypothetical protein